MSRTVRSITKGTYDQKTHSPSSVRIPEHDRGSCRDSWCGMQPPMGHALSDTPKPGSVQDLRDRVARGDGDSLTEHEKQTLVAYNERESALFPTVNGEAMVPAEAVNHPAHYGGETNTYEAIKVIEAWDLGFCLGNAVKYIARADYKGTPIVDLRKSLWYIQREIERREFLDASARSD